MKVTDQLWFMGEGEERGERGKERQEVMSPQQVTSPYVPHVWDKVAALKVTNPRGFVFEGGEREEREEAREGGGGRRGYEPLRGARTGS